MDYEKEIERRNKKIENLKKDIAVLCEEITAYKELLDCAAANLVLTVKEKGGKLSLSKKEVSEALGKYRLKAEDDGDGNYILEILSE